MRFCRSYAEDKLNERDILNGCLDQLRQLAPLKRVRRAPAHRTGRRVGSGVDVLVDVETERGPLRFAAEMKPMLKRPLPEHVSLVRRKIGERFLLMSEYVNPSIAATLRDSKINFIDTLGNAYIHVPGFIYVEKFGRKPEVQGEKQPTALLQPKGMRLLYVLLTEKGALNQTVRLLRARAGISLERTASSMRELQDRGYARTVARRELVFVNKKALLELWLANYGDRLRPGLVLGSFKMPESIGRDATGILQSAFGGKPQSYALGGSLGAYLLTGYYRGLTTEIFIREGMMGEFKKRLKLIPAKQTNVTLLHLFSPSVIYTGKAASEPVAHPLLIYAELLYQGGDREKETASLIYDRYLKDDFDGS
jgi:hypothetical protein